MPSSSATATLGIGASLPASFSKAPPSSKFPTPSPSAHFACVTSDVQPSSPLFPGARNLLAFAVPRYSSHFASVTSDVLPQLPAFPGARNRLQTDNTHEQRNPSLPPEDLHQLRTARPGEVFDKQHGLLCVELSAGRRRAYTALSTDAQHAASAEGFNIVEDRQTHQRQLKNLFLDYFLPQGYPDTVAPQYGDYMFWRGIQYFFGGAISVFTTKSLLAAVGVTGRGSSETAAAINWVLKDGAGRLGRLLFARWGRELDCELKQFRLAGDLLMETGAALELSTKWLPGAFLPLACTANLAKNLAAVAASSTRAPIYKTFALNNNMADITAKGESVANLADILGTLCGIMLSRAALPMIPTFCCLSLGYLYSSRREVDAVELPYLNRARLDYSIVKFIETGSIPSIPEANHNEPLLPWGKYSGYNVVLGATLAEACRGPADLHRALCGFKHERYALTYRDDNRTMFVLLKEGAQMTDCLKAMFCAHICLQFVEPKAPFGSALDTVLNVPSITEAMATGNLTAALDTANHLYADFMKQAAHAGWNLKSTVLNPRDVRLANMQALVF